MYNDPIRLYFKCAEPQQILNVTILGYLSIIPQQIRLLFNYTVVHTPDTSATN